MKALRQYRKLTYEQFSRDRTISRAAERYFQLAIQAALDIGAVILSEEGVKVPEEYRDIFPRLADIGVLPPEFASKLVGMAKFRNVLVHLYLQVDPALVYHYLQHDLGDLERFAQYVGEYLHNKGQA
ncbi:MAG: DUF86 domain-containing protein [Anaerolineae bacterium]|nr:DUF86 domain-containing protein [Anaerolineae bacterium]